VAFWRRRLEVAPATVAEWGASDRDVASRLRQDGRRIARAGVAASAVLACTNIAVGLLAHSTSVPATGLEFAGDVIASTIFLGGMSSKSGRLAEARVQFERAASFTRNAREKAFLLGRAAACGG